ncbi:MAG TPA: EamA family transporter [Lacipirellulaceae bacterium]|jgi:drug/metabolite transporter (DMT)-like permease
MDLLAFAFICIVWGSSFIATERASHALGPIGIGVWRLLGGTAVLAVLWVIHHRNYRVARRDWPLLLVYTVTVAVAYIIQPYVLEQGFGHSFFSAMVALIPLMTIVTSLPILNVRPTGREILGVVGGLVCIVLLLSDGFNRGMSLGLIGLALLIPLSSALGNPLIKRSLSHAPALPLTAASLGCAGLMLVPMELFPTALTKFGLDGPPAPHDLPVVICAMLFLTVVGTALSTAAFMWLVIRRGPLFPSMSTYIVPIVGLLWGRYDHEAITPRQLIAMTGVLLMVALVQFGNTQQPTLAISVQPTIEPALGPREAA